MKHIYKLLLLAIFIAGGCSTGSDPAGTNSNPTLNQNPVAGEFGYILNGTMTDRKDFPLSSTGQAIVETNAGLGTPPNSKLLFITLTTFDFFLAGFLSRSMEIAMPFSPPATG